MQKARNERETQNRVVALFKTMGYTYLGNWEEREGNAPIEEELLLAYLRKTGKYSENAVKQALQTLKKTASMSVQDDLYTTNKEVYSLLRYGTSKKTDSTTNKHETVHFIDWERFDKNDFYIAEEVTIKNAKERRPDIVLYINGIAIGVLELKRASVSATEGIRQNISNQTHLFNKPFFATVQFVLAGNDSTGLHYGTTNTSEKFFLQWKEDNEVQDAQTLILDRHIKQFCDRERLWEVMHDFVVFDHGRKKLCRPNQYFGVKKAQEHIKAGKGGIIWHTQGSGKSLTMVWLAKWILENKPQARILIVTDRSELDIQIEGVFKGVEENIYRTYSGQDLLKKLNDTKSRLLCTLVHKFGEKDEDSMEALVKELKLPKGFSVKGDFVVFVDECHRTQNTEEGGFHYAMKKLLPHAIFIGFTGTPLLKKDKKTSWEVFGQYIHTYKFNDAVKDGVVLDLLYEARDVDQHIYDQQGIDDWFELVTKGMNPLPKAELKQKWGTMQKVLSTKSRLEKIVFDIKKDFLAKPRLRDGRGNAILVARSIYEACRYYEIFQSFGFKKCAIITSYQPNASGIKLDDTGEGDTEKKEQFEIYQKMLENYGFKDDVEGFETFAKNKFKDEPANMQLLIVVDKLLTGFDAIHCTYLYIDKEMQDHSLFQAICRTNRLGEEEETDMYYKEFGYIIDYKNLLKNLNKSITAYTSDAFDAFDAEDVKDLVTDRLQKAKERLQDALEALHKLCFDIAPPQEIEDYYCYFCGDTAQPEELKEREEQRLAFYKLVVALVRAYNNIAPEIEQAGYTAKEAEKVKQKVNKYVDYRNSVKHHSGDYIDMKKYEPDMRQMLDMYLTADPSKVLSNFGEATLLDLIVEHGIEQASQELPEGIKKRKESINETIENNMRQTIIQEMPMNPAHYVRMSKLLLELIQLRKAEAITYEELLKRYEELARQIRPESQKTNYPTNIDTQTKQVLYDNLGQDEALTLAMDKAILSKKDDEWRSTPIKRKKIEIAIRETLQQKGIIDEAEVKRIFELVENQKGY